MLRITAAIAFLATNLSVFSVAHAQDRLEEFSKHDPKSTMSLGYDELTKTLRTIVYDVGRSDRKPATRPVNYTGSNLSRQNKERYRLEGNRISFSMQSGDLERRFELLREGLENTAASVGLENLNRREQLAFWLNLHNTAVVEQLAKIYPVRSTRILSLQGGEDDFFTAPVVTVQGQPLSLNDIRIGIVYQNYRTPEVIYGFFLGSIGGPNIRREAFTAATLERQLRDNADEFINSLRGVESNRRRIRVSQIYEEARALFPNWPDDLLAHLRAYGESDVNKTLSQKGRIHADVFSYTIADLSYGDASAPIGNVLSTSRTGTGGFHQVGGQISPYTLEFVSKVEERKYRRFKERGGTVEIIDVDTEDGGGPEALIPIEDPHPGADDAANGAEN